eukprot:g608.t1
MPSDASSEASQQTPLLEPDEYPSRGGADAEDSLGPLLRAVFVSLQEEAPADAAGAGKDESPLCISLPKHSVLTACSPGGDSTGARQLILMGLTQAIDAGNTLDERCLKLLLNPVSLSGALRDWEGGIATITADSLVRFCRAQTEDEDKHSTEELVLALFDAIDVNHDGKISKKEVLHALRDPDSSASKLINHVAQENAKLRSGAKDDSQKGSTGNQAYLNGESLELLLHPRKYAEAFKAMDTNASGFVTIEELMAFCHVMDPQQTASEQKTQDAPAEAFSEGQTDSPASASDSVPISTAASTAIGSESASEASAAYMKLETLCSTMHHLGCEALGDIREKVERIGAHHEDLLNAELQNVDMRKIVQFQATTRCELLVLTNPPKAVKSVMLPLCSLFGMKRKWQNARRALTLLKGGSVQAFSHLRDLLTNHVRGDPKEMSLMLFEGSSAYNGSSDSTSRVDPRRVGARDSKHSDSDKIGETAPLSASGYARNFAPPSLPPLIDELREIIDDPQLFPEKLAAVSVAAASLCYMYRGMVEYSEIWQRSYEHRRVTDSALRKMRAIDRLMTSIESTKGPGARKTAAWFKNNYKSKLVSALRRSAAMHTVLGGSVSSLPGREIDEKSRELKRASSQQHIRSNRPDSHNGDFSTSLTASQLRRAKREALIANPFPKVKHKEPWKGSPSSTKELSYSSSSNHFIVNIQEIPRHPPPLPQKLRRQKKKKKKKKKKEELKPIQKHNVKHGGRQSERPQTAPIGQQKPQQSLSRTSIEEEEDYYADDFDSSSPAASPVTEHSRLGTIPNVKSVDEVVKDTQSGKLPERRNQEREVSDVIDKRHRIMRIKQRGALAAAVAMTEAELPEEVDDVVEKNFDGISEKIFAGWRDRRGLMMTFPSVIKGLESTKKRPIRARRGGKKGKFISEKDLSSAMQCVGLDLSEEEFAMFCRLLYPKNQSGHFSSEKATELVMAGHALLGSASDAAAGGSKRSSFELSV